jgi:hypothetical protein
MMIESRLESLPRIADFIIKLSLRLGFTEYLLGKYFEYSSQSVRGFTLYWVESKTR